MKTSSIFFGSRNSSGYELKVQAVDGAAIVAEWVNPFTEEEFRQVVESPICFGSSATHVDILRGAEVERGVDVGDLGKRLFDSLFCGQIRDLLIASRAQLEPGELLRIELQFAASEPTQLQLYSLPWELLHDGQGFLALSSTAIVRRLWVPKAEALAPLRVDRLQVLAAVLDSKNLDVDREIALLEKVREQTENFEFELLPRGATLSDLRARLQEGRFHALHLIGHGRLDPELREWGLDSPDGFLQASHLAQQLGRNLPRLRLVVLNSCRSGRVVSQDIVAADAGIATALVGKGSVAVVAMQGPISDLAAIQLPYALYRRLATTGDLGQAMEEVRLELKNQERKGVPAFEWAIPVQLERSQSPLFDLKSAPDSQPRPPKRGMAALACGATGLVGLLPTLGIHVAHSNELMAIATGALGALLAIGRELGRWIGGSLPGGGGDPLAGMAGWLAKSRWRAVVIGVGPWLVASLSWFTLGAPRLAVLPCLQADLPGDLDGLVAIKLDAGLAPALRPELRDLALRLGREPFFLTSEGAGEAVRRCLPHVVDAQLDEAAGTAVVEVDGRNVAKKVIAVPWAGDPDRAIRQLVAEIAAEVGGEERIPGLDPESTSYQLDQEALGHYWHGNLGKALEIWRDAVRKDGDEGILRNNLAEVLIRIGQHKADQALFLPEWDKPTRRQLVESAREAFAEARSHLDHALMLEPGQAIYAYNRGRVRQKLGDEVEARRDFLAALEAWPTFAEAANDLAVLDLEAGDAAAAKKRLDNALRWSATVPETRAALLKNLGRARQATGELSEAAAALEDALKLAPPELFRLRAEALARLAEVHAALLGNATACVTWERYARDEAARDDPDPDRRGAFKKAMTACRNLPRGQHEKV